MDLTLINGEINEKTQLQIENFLKDQYLEFVDKKYLNKQTDINYNYLTHNLINILDDSKENFIKLINNYKNNILFEDKNLDKLSNKIIFSTNNDYIINISYGRLLRIISNTNMINNSNKTLEVILDLGKELINNYLLNLYKQEKNNFNLNTFFLD